MNINLLLPVLLLLAVWRAWRGFKNGLADEVYRLISLLAALFVLALVLMAVTSFQEDEVKNGVIAVMLLIVTGISLHLFGTIKKALQAIAGLPIISFLNSLFGLAAGIAEVVVAAWLMYYIIAVFPTGAFGVQIMEWTRGSEWLTRLYEANQITEWLQAFLGNS